MGRIIAIDYGRKRTGLAVTDPLQMIANGLTTVPSGEVVHYLVNYVAKEVVDLFVVGLPKQMNNEPSENMKYVEAFVAHLKRAIPSIPIQYYDERFTSVMAHQAMLSGGLKTVLSLFFKHIWKVKNINITYDFTYLFIRPACP